MVRGLENNGYFIENPIYLRFDGFERDVKRIEITIENLTNGLVSRSNYIYPNINNEALFDIAPLIKSHFTLPRANQDYSEDVFEFNNINEVSISISVLFQDDTTENQTFQKKFLRAGKSVNESNIFIQEYGGRVLITEKMPHWNGFPNAEYYFTANLLIRKITRYANYNESWGMIEVMPILHCDSKYIKFLNDKGVYSYWLFENFTKNPRSQSKGSFSIPNWNESKAKTEILTTDLGTDREERITLESEVPSRYIEIISQLINSEEVYLYTPENFDGSDVDTNWTRLLNENNSVSLNNYSNAYDVSLTFKIPITQNPKLLW